MRKTLVFILLSISIPLFCQSFVVPFREESKLKILEGQISNVKIDFIFDTGASKTLISETIWNEIISVSNNYEAVRIDTFVIADGSMTIGKIYRIPKLMIKEIIVGPIEIVVIRGSNMNLLGQNFLKEFKSYTVGENSIEFNYSQNNRFFGLDMNRSVSNFGFSRLAYYETPKSQFGKTLKFNPLNSDFNETFSNIHAQNIYLTFNDKEECYIVTIKEIFSSDIFNSSIYKRFNEYSDCFQTEYGNPIEKMVNINKDEVIKWSSRTSDLVLKLDWTEQTIWAYYLKK
jgi:hypothetical protein